MQHSRCRCFRGGGTDEEEFGCSAHMELQPGLDFPWQDGTEDVEVSRAHRTLLRECSLTGTVETGEVYSAAVTNYDGGCALHATWGVPCPHPRHAEGQWYE